MSSLLDYLISNRPLQLHADLPPGMLLAADFTGREEISRLYCFEMSLLTPRPLSVDFASFLGKEAAIELRPASTVTRYFHGLINRFSEGRKDEHFTHYSATMVPKFWLWTREIRNRVFQRQTVPEILTTVLNGLDVKQNLTATYLPREYCVQYQESDFAFASRLMEEEGIYYYFDHRVDGHTMVLVDSHFQLPDVPGPAVVRFDELEGGVLEELRVSRWRKSQRICTSQVTLWDYNFQMPDDHLEAQQQLQEQIQVGTVTHQLKAVDQTLEHYQYPGGYARHFDGVNPSGADESADLSHIFEENQRIVRVRMEADAAEAIWTEGKSNCAQFLPGHHFNLLWHGSGDGQYLLKSVEHSAKLDMGYRSDSTQSEMKYENTFVCLPGELPFRPRRVTETPIIRGIQTAKVVGPSGDQVFIDKYGRIKIQFQWDRLGHMDGNSSCWVRVAQFWAGNRWGAFFWPRLGQEVVVIFEEGNPDRPLIIGSTYNADNMPPFELPDHLNLTGIRSCTLAGNGTQNYNTVVFDDSSGDEHLSLHSENHVHVSSEQANYNYVPHQQLQMIGSLPFGSGSGGGPSNFRPQSKESVSRPRARARLVLPPLEQGLVYTSGLGGGRSPRSKKKASSAGSAKAKHVEPPKLGLPEDFEILMQQVLGKDLLRQVAELRQAPVAQRPSGQGGGLWDFPAAVAACGGGSEEFQDFFEHQMPSSFKITCGDSVGVFLRDNITRYWSAAGKIISDLESIVIGGALGALEVSPEVEMLLGLALGFDGTLNANIGGSATLNYGGNLSVNRGESLKVTQHAFWHTGVTGLTLPMAETAQAISVAIRLLLVIMVIGSLVVDLILRIKCVPTATDGTVHAEEAALFFYNALYSRYLGVICGMEKMFAKLQKVMDNAAQADRDATQATEILTRADGAATDIAASQVEDAERRLQGAINGTLAMLVDTAKVAAEASNHTRRIEGNYRLSAAGDMSFISANAAGPSSISIRAEGSGALAALPGTTGSLNLVGTQAVNMSCGGAGGIRVAGSPVSVREVAIDAGIGGTAKMFTGVPEEGPRLIMDPIGASLQNGPDEVGSAITWQVAELGLSCGIPGVGSAIKLTPESLTLSVGENIWTLTPEGLTKEVLMVESETDLTADEQFALYCQMVDGILEIEAPMNEQM